jgi:hypothetical protein
MVKKYRIEIYNTNKWESFSIADDEEIIGVQPSTSLEYPLKIITARRIE